MNLQQTENMKFAGVLFSYLKIIVSGLTAKAGSIPLNFKIRL